MQTDKRFYSVKDVAEILDIGINTAYKLMKSKKFPAIKIGRIFRVDKAAFDEWALRLENKNAY